MSNNDLIDRALVLELFDKFCAEYLTRLAEEVGGDTQEELTANEIAEIVVENARALRCAISLFPAVPQPMSAVEFLKAFSILDGKELHFVQGCVAIGEFDIAVSYAQKWAQEHPERSEEE